MTITYEVGNNLYLNITNKCSNSCTFCLRNDGDYNGINLWLKEEPTYEQIIEDLKKRDLTIYNEMVFCGFGEPLERYETCIETAKYLKENNKKIRINTNGQANLIHKKDITPELAGLIDIISISLNAKNSKEYQELCNSKFGEESFEALQTFAKLCSAKGTEVIMTIVDLLSKSDIDECRKIAENCGATLRIRKLL